MSSKSKYEISQVIQRFLENTLAKYPLSGQQRSILKLISICKTSALGGHRESCYNCGHDRIHYNSCGNRNCPSCQGANRALWVHDRQQDLLPVKYFHCVFTIPSELYIYFRFNKKLLYDLLLRCTKETLMTFGHDPKHGINGKIGGIALLHTWTQQMTYHPHVHCIVPGGGLGTDNSWRPAKKSKGNYLFPVRAMSVVFRGKLLEGIHKYYTQNLLNLPVEVKRAHRPTKNLLYKKDWVVYAKKAFGGPQQVFQYLGLYTHRICMANSRILHISDTHLTVKYTDRKANKVKFKKIPGEIFLKLFAEHILPKGFVKIRHFGFLSARTKARDLACIRSQLNVDVPPPKVKMNTKEFIIMTAGKNPHICPICKKTELVITQVIHPIRGSPAKVFPRPLPKYRMVVL